jgi:hypothetical protein
MESLHKEIIILICHWLNKDIQLISFGKISKYYNYLIKTTKWYHVTIYTRDKHQLEHILSLYQFMNFHPYWITDVSSFIDKLKHCHTLDFSYSDIKNNDVKKLKKCHTLNLSLCDNIDDSSVKKLGKCHTLNIGHTIITDISVKKLGNCHTLILNATKITDDGLSYLSNCHKISLYNCKNITDKGMIYLKKCNIINLYGNTQITDIGIKELSKCYELDITETSVTDIGLKELKDCHKLCIGGKLITDNGIKELKNCYELDLSECQKVTFNSICLLTECVILNLSYTKMIDDRIINLKKLKILRLDEYDKISPLCLKKLEENGCKIITDERM